MPNQYAYSNDPLVGVDFLGLEITWMDPKKLNFSQRTISDETHDKIKVSDMTADMAENGFDLDKGKPLQVMEVDGQFISYDNRRLVAAQNANLSSVPVEIVDPEAPHPKSTAGKTWKQKFKERRYDKRNKVAGGVVPKSGLKEQPKILPCKG